MRGVRMVLLGVAVALVGCGPKATPPDTGLDDPNIQKGIEDGTVSNPSGPPMGQGRFKPGQQLESGGKVFKGPDETGGGGSAPQ